MAKSVLLSGAAIARALPWQFATTTFLLASVMVTNAHAEVRILDFEQDAQGNALDGGTQVRDEWAEWGLKLQGKNYKTKQYDNKAPLLLYNTSQSGADNDLRTGANWGTPDQGNALIIQEYQGSINS